MIVPILLAAMMMHRPGESRLTMDVGGRERSFVLYTPEGVNSGEPLVIALHGRLGTGAGMEKLTHLERIAAREKFLLIYPDGIRKSWNDGRETPAEKQGVDDVAFIRALMDSAVRHCGADKKRIYLTGISNGGYMTMRAAIELSDRIAAAAVVAATMDSGVSHDGAQPVSMLIIHGTRDPLVPFEGGSVHRGAGGPILSHDAAVEWWKIQDGCLGEGTARRIGDSASDGTTVTITAYSGGAAGGAGGTNGGAGSAEVIGYVIDNGGHTWPGGWQYLPVFMVGKTSRNLDASEVIWAFFKRHARE